jgi:mRNA-degrading endonuclease toxin of MazEF toxin-antitoxin module
MLMRIGGNSNHELAVDHFLRLVGSYYRLGAGWPTSCDYYQRGAPESDVPVVNVLPLTSRKSPTRTIYPNEVLFLAGTAGLPVDSIVLCYQIRTLDKRRLEQAIGELRDKALQTAIADAIRFQLEL